MNLSKKQITKVCNALRSGKYTKIKGTVDKGNNCVCAMGVIFKELIPAKDIILGHDGTISRIKGINGYYDHPMMINLSDRMGAEIYNINDSGSFYIDGERYEGDLSFNELADVLEATYLHGALD